MILGKVKYLYLILYHIFGPNSYDIIISHLPTSFPPIIHFHIHLLPELRPSDNYITLLPPPPPPLLPFWLTGTTLISLVSIVE